MGLKKVLIVGMVSASTLFSVSAFSSDALIKKISGTREAICYNHPNKSICIDGINALLKSAVAAAGLDKACKDVSELGGKGSNNCTEAEDVVKWIESSE
ncbi:Uncharacterised protein [Yersinia aldovae]|uniref:hypothetical protein n=1 Tax=Yersinia aldovae TaxID=29483 RepID=UPI0005EA23C3|nr:hypothetical protein [Yersinia aldovae]CNJ18934.1 Uncharacterised protein [Yersinia aldovae]